MGYLGRLVRGGSKGSARRFSDTSAALPSGVVAAGYLYILHASKTIAKAHSRSSWKRRYFVLHADGVVSGRWDV